MITMNQINDIRYLSKVQGLKYSDIKKITGCAYETIKKYEELEDFNNIKIKNNNIRKTKLDNFKDIIKKWILDDKGAPYKQRHTAKRIHQRLLEKFPDTYTASYRTLTTHVNKVKKELNLGKEEYLKLVHLEDEAQVDFGKVTFYELGREVKGSYLVLTLPYSNAGFLQIFHGETQECLLEGLKNIFKHIGKVPSKIWFDNLSAAVKIVNKKERKINSLFQQFSNHYSFKPVFCGPAKGNEKGAVENKVGYLRNNYLVPIPKFNDINKFNEKLLKLCDKDHKRIHYEKRKYIEELFQEQLLQMQQLPKKDFEVFRIIRRKTNKYGNIEFDTNNYSVSSKEKKTEVNIKVEANYLTVYDNSGAEIVKHRRCYDKYKNIINHNESIELIIKKITALENTEFYQQLPKIWKDIFLDKDNEQKRRLLKVLNKILITSTIEVATMVLQEAINAGTLDPDYILSIFYRYIDLEYKSEELENLPKNVPKIEEYLIDLNKYNNFLGGRNE